MNNMAESYAAETLGDNWQAVLSYADRLRGGEKPPSWSNEAVDDLLTEAKFRAGSATFTAAQRKGAEVTRYLMSVLGKGGVESFTGLLAPLLGGANQSAKEQEAAKAEVMAEAEAAMVVSAIGTLFCVPIDAVPASVRPNLGL